MLVVGTSNCSFPIPPWRPTVSGVSTDTRRANLKRLLDERFFGRIVDMADKIERGDAYLWQLLNGERNVGERVARHIETKLDLAPYALDSEEMAGHETLSPDERELLAKYRRASPSWRLSLRLLAGMRAEDQDNVSEMLNELMSKIVARPDYTYGKPAASRRFTVQEAPPARSEATPPVPKKRQTKR